MYRLVVSLNRDTKYVLSSPRITPKTTVGQLRTIVRDTAAEFYTITLDANNLLIRHAAKSADIRDLSAPYVQKRRICLRACVSPSSFVMQIGPRFRSK
jgi:hypothetical protein